MKKNELASNSVASSCRWKSNESVFVLGPSKITKEGVTEIYHLNAEISTLYGMNGHIAGWAVNAAKLIDYPAVRYKAYVSCVPSLLKLLYFTSYILFQDLPTGKR
jgi:uncharacterized protein (DUF927 family)